MVKTQRNPYARTQALDHEVDRGIVSHLISAQRVTEIHKSKIANYIFSARTIDYRTISRSRIYSTHYADVQIRSKQFLSKYLSKIP